MAQYVAQAKWLTEVLGPERAKQLTLTRSLWSKLVEGNLPFVKSAFDVRAILSSN
jgi:hypothetical protein